MKRLYLDMNIYNRPFDDQFQIRIRLEAMAVNAILKMIKEGKFTLIWSFMLEYENSLNPYEDVRMEIDMVSSLSLEYVDMAKNILKDAKEFESKGIRSRDAIHLACAIKGKTDYFLTCDDRLIKKAGIIKSNVEIINPIDFIRLEVK
jgi:predicted nucleic acid-binding protein